MESFATFVLEPSELILVLGPNMALSLMGQSHSEVLFLLALLPHCFELSLICLLALSNCLYCFGVIYPHVELVGVVLEYKDLVIHRFFIIFFTQFDDYNDSHELPCLLNSQVFGIGYKALFLPHTFPHALQTHSEHIYFRNIGIIQLFLDTLPHA